MSFARAHFLIAGRVQGVGFRAQAKRKAKNLGLKGWVKNLFNGRVEMIIEGSKEKIEELIEWAKKGTSLAKVSDIKIEWEEYEGEFNNFKIMR